MYPGFYFYSDTVRPTGQEDKSVTHNSQEWTSHTTWGLKGKHQGQAGDSREGEVEARVLTVVFTGRNRPADGMG